MSKIYLDFTFNKIKDVLYATFIDENLEEIETRAFATFEDIHAYVAEKNAGKTDLIINYLNPKNLDKIYKHFAPTLQRGINKSNTENATKHDLNDMASAAKVKFFTIINTETLEHKRALKLRFQGAARKAAEKTTASINASLAHPISNTRLISKIRSTKREILTREGRAIDNLEVSKILGITWTQIADATGIPLKEIQEKLKSKALKDDSLKTELETDCGISGSNIQIGTGHTINELAEVIVDRNFKTLTSNQRTKTIKRIHNDLKAKLSFSYRRIRDAASVSMTSKDAQPSMVSQGGEEYANEINPKLDYEMYKATKTSDDGMDRELDHKKMAAALHKAVAELPKQQQTVLAYTYGLGDSDILQPNELAEKLKITVRAVNALKNKALTTLRNTHEKYPVLKEYNDEYLVDKVHTKRKMSIFA